MLKVIRRSKLNWTNKPAAINKDPVPQSLLKRIPVEGHGVRLQSVPDEINWIPIYRFPYIKACRLAIKFKLFLTGTSIGILAMKLSDLVMQNPVPLTHSNILLLISTTGLVLVGQTSRRLICQLYTTDDLHYIRAARLTFFGNRRDMVLPCSSVIPLANVNSSAKNPLLKVRFMKPDTFDHEHDNIEFYDEKFYISLVYGGLLDLNRFEKIFGYLLSRSL